MSSSSDSFSVFVSSTSEDLESYRKIAEGAILDLQWRPEMMEHFVAETAPTLETCFQRIDKCDLVLAIIAWRQGWVPSQDQGGNGRDSVTALEIAHARSKNIPVLYLLANNLWPVSLSEDEQEKRQWMRSFRDVKQVAGFFGPEEEAGLPRFAALVKQTLVLYKERILASRHAGAPSLDFFGSASEGLLQGKNVPVIGSGLYGDGPLSSTALARALFRLSDRVPMEVPKERLSLATIAEYRERLESSREQFLEMFQSILEQQSKEAPPSPVIELLAKIDCLRLVVSTMYDSQLEDKLYAAGRKIAVVSHVLRSYENQDNGKVILFRRGSKPRLFKANELEVEPDDCIVYKPLGSPLLHKELAPELEIDTVVVTETDHASFLQRLESPETGVPSSIKRRFRSPLLFLGYTLDVWQYRLTMLVYQVANRDPSRVTMAVRIPDDAIEEVAWNRLNAQLIRMDPAQFARSASGRPAA